jgi:hypothetical protein
VVLPRPHLFRLREPSLARGVLLSLGTFVASLRLAGFPYIERLHGSRWQLLAVPFACWGMVETVRCLHKERDLYHAGVMIMLCTELMILAMVLALWAIL